MPKTDSRDEETVGAGRGSSRICGRGLKPKAGQLSSREAVPDSGKTGVSGMKSCDQGDRTG